MAFSGRSDCCVQVEQELQRAAGKAHDIEDMQARLQVDKQRLDIQLGQAKEGVHQCWNPNKFLLILHVPVAVHRCWSYIPSSLVLHSSIAVHQCWDPIKFLLIVHGLIAVHHGWSQSLLH